MTRGSRPVMIGRERLLGEALASLDRQNAHAGALVTGPAGVGVSRLLDEVATRATEAGRRVARIAGSDVRRPPFADAALLVGPVAGLIEARAALAAGPDVVVVDDADRLDPGTAELLWHVACDRSCRVLLGTHETRGCHRLLAALWRQGHLVRIDVEPLDRLAAEQLLVAHLGGPVDARTTRSLHHLSAGLPLLLLEVATTSVASARLAPTAGVWRLDGVPPSPARVHDLVAEQFDNLQPDLQEALDLVAVTEPLPLVVGETLLGKDVVRQLASTGRAGVIEEASGAYLAVHPPLLGLVRRAAIDPIRRNDLCGRALDVDVGEVDRLTVARWSVDGGRRPPTEVVVDAAREALLDLDLDLARRLAELVLEDPEALYILGRSLERQGHVDQAAQVHRELVEDADAPLALRVVAGVNLADMLLWSLGDGEGATRLAEQLAGEVRAASDGTEPPELQAFLAGQQLFVGRTDDAIRRLSGMEAQADGATRSEILILRGTGLAIAGRAEQALDTASQGLELAAAPNARADGTQVELHHVVQLLALNTAGQLDGAAAAIDHSLAVALDGAETSSGWVALAASLVALNQGVFDRAAALARRAAAVFEVMDNRTGRRWGIGGELMAAASQGKSAEAAELARHLEVVGTPAVMFMEPTVLRAEAWGLVVAGELGAALEQLTHAAHLAAATGQQALEAEALHDAVRLGRPHEVEARLGALVGEVDGALASLRHGHAAALVAEDPDRLLGLARVFGEVGSPLWAAEAAGQAATLLHHRGRTARSRAAAAEVIRWRARTEGAATPAIVAAVTLGLTAREREVAVRAAGGDPSRLIADELGISPRTVDNLLHRAYMKLGVSGRSELAAVLR